MAERAIATRRRNAPFEEVLAGVREAVAEDLAPNMHAIDGEGVYPEAFMRRVGSVGGFRQGTPEALCGAGRGIGATIRTMEEVAKTCLSTGFCVWCQTVCAWYIQNGASEYLKERVLPDVISGEALAGTGLSNPMKHLSGIERLKIGAERRPGGYSLTGTVPWVSNSGKGHYFAVVAGIEANAGGGLVMALVRGGDAGLELKPSGPFIALEGSNTYSVVLKDVFVSEENVLAGPGASREYIGRIRPGFVLTQAGIGLGLVQSCVEIMQRANRRSDIERSGVNGFLDDGVESLGAELAAAREKVYALAGGIGCGEEAPPEGAFREATRARLAVSELSLRAAQAAMLHMGAAGYRLGGEVERKVRESYFVAVVTPAIKHLRKALHDMDDARAS